MGCCNSNSSVDPNETAELERKERMAIEKKRQLESGQSNYNGYNDNTDICINKDDENLNFNVTRNSNLNKSKNTRYQNVDNEKDNYINFDNDEQFNNYDDNNNNFVSEEDKVNLLTGDENKKGKRVELGELKLMRTVTLPEMTNSLPNLIKEDLPDFRDTCLRIHNYYRSEHGSDELVLNEHLCKLAQESAEYFAITEQMKPTNTEYKKEILGENLYSGEQLSPSIMINSWYNKLKLYNFDDPENNSAECNPFTQLIWKGTEEFGCGYARGDSGTYYAVAYYYPGGNIKGQFDNNIEPTF